MKKNNNSYQFRFVNSTTYVVNKPFNPKNVQPKVVALSKSSYFVFAPFSSK